MENENKATIHYTDVLLDQLTDTISEAMGDNYDLTFYIGGKTGDRITDIKPVQVAVTKMYDHIIAIIRYDETNDNCMLRWSHIETHVDFAKRLLNLIGEKYLYGYPSSDRFATPMSYDRVYNYERLDLVNRYFGIAKEYNKGEEFSGMSDLDLTLRILDLSEQHVADVDEMEYFFLANTDSNLIASALHDELPQRFNIDEWSSCRGEVCPKCGSDHTHPVGYTISENPDNHLDYIHYHILCQHCGHHFDVD